MLQRTINNIHKIKTFDCRHRHVRAARLRGDRGRGLPNVMGKGKLQLISGKSPSYFVTGINSTPEMAMYFV
jgi:hypothetical protein